MDTTVCPWCQSEIVWDEELGPEEECPHCLNELKGYRTLNVSLNDDEEEIEQEHATEDAEARFEYEEEDWGQGRSRGLTRLPVIHGEETDLLAYEAAVGKILETQEQMPECPHCREYMLLTGQQTIQPEGFEATVSGAVKQSLLTAPFKMNVYICPSCFHSSSFLADESKVQLVRNVQSAVRS